MFGAVERVEDRVEKQFTKVVDGVGDERGNGQVVRTLHAFFAWELGEVDAGEDIC